MDSSRNGIFGFPLRRFKPARAIRVFIDEDLERTFFYGFDFFGRALVQAQKSSPK
jgi:hypothetical protein